MEDEDWYEDWYEDMLPFIEKKQKEIHEDIKLPTESKTFVQCPNCGRNGCEFVPFNEDLTEYWYEDCVYCK